MIDLRSDTVTKPTQEMRAVIANAIVGDDVYNEDPTVTKLEAMLVERTGMEAAIYASSGTQSNLLGIMSHCERGDEYIVGQTAHTYLWEGGGAAVLGSIQPQPLDFESDGTLSLNKVDMVIKPIDVYHARTKLLCLENTSEGKVLSLNYLKESSLFCKRKGIAHHLDGARVFNAAVELGVDLSAISQHFDSISICLSKGLGAPVGSVLCGSKDLIACARRWRKVLGGGMRQAGIVAAGCIYALENNVERLKEDHENCRRLADKLSEIEEIMVVSNSVHTNMLFIHTPEHCNELRLHLKEKGILLAGQFDRRGLIRLVTHLDISKDDIDYVVREIKAFYHKV